MKLQILIKETIGIERTNEPVHIPLATETLESNDFDVLATLESGETIPCQVYTDFNGIKTVVLTISCKSYEEKNGLYDTVVKSLENENIVHFELPGIKTNPSLSLVRRGIRIVRENQLGFILAIGGGSAIDTAKAIAAVFIMKVMYGIYFPENLLEKLCPPEQF